MSAASERRDRRRGSGGETTESARPLCHLFPRSGTLPPSGWRDADGKTHHLRIVDSRDPAAGDEAATGPRSSGLPARRPRWRGPLRQPGEFPRRYAVHYAKWGGDSCGRRVDERPKSTPRLRALAKELKIMLLLAPLHERPEMLQLRPAGRCDGRLIGRYDKTHLQDQDLRFDPGQSLSCSTRTSGPWYHDLRRPAMA